MLTQSLNLFHQRCLSQMCNSVDEMNPLDLKSQVARGSTLAHRLCRVASSAALSALRSSTAPPASSSSRHLTPLWLGSSFHVVLVGRYHRMKSERKHVKTRQSRGRDAHEAAPLPRHRAAETRVESGPWSKRERKKEGGTNSMTLTFQETQGKSLVAPQSDGAIVLSGARVSLSALCFSLRRWLLREWLMGKDEIRCGRRFVDGRTSVVSLKSFKMQLARCSVAFEVLKQGLWILKDD